MKHVILNGELMQAELAQLPVLDRAFTFGESVYTSIRVYGSKPFRLNRHVERLSQSLRLPEVAIPYAVNERQLERDIATLCSREECYDCIARFIITPGCAKEDETPNILLPSGASTLLILEPLEEGRSDKLSLCRGLAIRAKYDWLAAHKIGGRMRDLSALRLARKRGFDDALVIDENGSILCATSANVYAVCDGAIITPHLIRSNIIPGIMRELVLECAAREGIVVYQEDITEDVLRKSQEFFLSSSRYGVAGVGRIDDHQFCEGVVTSRIANAVSEKIRKEVPEI